MSEACRFEVHVLRAVREDRFTESLRAHLAECDQCVAAMSVEPWLDEFARVDVREHMLPDPSVLWLKAKLLQNSADVRRATRPMDLVQLIAYAVVAGGWAAMLTWRWSAVEAWLQGFTPDALVTSVGRAESLSLSFFALLFVLASMTVMLAMHTILAED
ncbi:MAG TPA: hypothetical protein VE010_08305 [Thermoanaerobaculia bacterium]|nr:hypothetical protein [Thermoanaerobaculia bacterium]